MKKYKVHILVGGLLLCTAFTWAQQVDYNKIILPEGAADVSYEERLVQLAWQNNPTAIMSTKQVEVADLGVKAAGLQWATLIGANINLNEYTIKELTGTENDTEANRNYFYPRYNVYLRVPLSTFWQIPNDRKTAKAQATIAREQMNQAKLDMRHDVLVLYQDYKMNEQIANLKKASMADEESNYLMIEQKFSAGEISVDEYMEGQRRRHEQQLENIQAQTTYQKAKLDLEAMIGVRLEDIR